MRNCLKVFIDTLNIIRDHSQFSEDEFTNSTGERGKIVCMLIFVQPVYYGVFVECMR